MTEEELCNTYDWYEPHQKWLRGEEGGVQANHEWAGLSDANLTGAYLNGAYLSNTDLRSANLVGAKFDGAKLEGAKITGSIIDGRWVHPGEEEGTDD